MKKIMIKVSDLLLGFFIIFLSISYNNIVLADTFTIMPIEDSHVDSEQPDRNFADYPLGVLKFNYTVPIGVLREQISYVKFDLSIIDDAEQIDTIFYNASWQSASQCSSPQYIDIYHVTDDSWDEGNLTWNNQPGYDDYLGTLLFDIDNPSQTFWRQWDISSYDYSSDLDDNTLSIAMVKRNPDSCGVAFRTEPFLEISTQPAPESIVIDIIPKACPNECHIKGGGFVEVAILGTVDFDVNDIDIASVRLEGISAVRSKLKDKSTPVSSHFDDCDCTTEGRDGFIDLCLKFDKKVIISVLGEVNLDQEYVLTLSGELNDGTLIEGKDCIVFIEKGKKN